MRDMVYIPVHSVKIAKMPKGQGRCLVHIAERSKVLLHLGGEGHALLFTTDLASGEERPHSFVQGLDQIRIPGLQVVLLCWVLRRCCKEHRRSYR